MTEGKKGTKGYLEPHRYSKTWYCYYDNDHTNNNDNNDNDSNNNNNDDNKNVKYQTFATEALVPPSPRDTGPLSLPFSWLFYTEYDEYRALYGPRIETHARP